MTRLIITGSRWFDGHRKFFDVIDHVHTRAAGEILTLVHLELVGAESMASEIAEENADVGFVDEPWPKDQADAMIAAGADHCYGFFREGANTAAGEELVLAAHDAGIHSLEFWS